MKRPEQNFCDFCKEHVKDDSEGEVIFMQYEGIAKTSLLNRIFDKATPSDVCICNLCKEKLVALWKRKEGKA